MKPNRQHALVALVLFSAAGRSYPIEVVLDVGHSLAAPGAISARGIFEFEYNRALTEVVAAELERRGFRVRIQGLDGRLDDLHARPGLAAGADLLLSIHHDSVQPRYLQTWMVDGQPWPYSDRFSGYSLFVSRHNPQLERSLACASAIGKALAGAGFRASPHHAEAIPGENRPYADPANGVHYHDDLVVLKYPSIPAVLLEAGILVNRAEEEALQRPEARARIAGAVAAGLTTCLGAPAR